MQMKTKAKINRGSKLLTVRTSIKAGGLTLNHSQRQR
jgi:hypothetical protein